MKIGFIVEGYAEKIIIDSAGFKNWATQQGIIICKVINAKGRENLLPKNIKEFVKQIKFKQADYIVILTDLENEPDEQKVIKRITKEHTEFIFIAVKAIEAWFLADDLALKKWLRVDAHEKQPEKTMGMPWRRIEELASKYDKKVTNKLAFAERMVKDYKFSLERAAQHPNCPSAKKFHDGLLAIAQS